MSLTRSGYVVLAVLLLLTGCSSNEEKKALEPLPLVDFESTTSLKKIWSSGVGEGQAKNLYSLFYLAAEENKIFAADHEGNVFAFDAQKGKRVWKAELEVAIGGAVSVAAGQVFVGTFDGDVIALSAENGTELWRAAVSSEVLAPPQSNGTQVAVASINGALTVLDAKTGTQLWAYGHLTPTLTLRGLAAPVLTTTQVIAAFDNGQVLAFNAADGASLWETRVAQPTGRHDLERLIDIDGTPLLQGGVLYAATYQGAVAALARAQGRMLWKQDLSTFLPLAAAERKVFATAADGKVVAYNANTGAVEWENSQLLRRSVGAPSIIGSYVAVIDGEGYMHLLDQSDGKFAERISAKGKRFRSPMLSYEDKLYVLSGDGKLTAYMLDNQSLDK